MQNAGKKFLPGVFNNYLNFEKLLEQCHFHDFAYTVRFKSVIINTA